MNSNFLVIIAFGVIAEMQFIATAIGVSVLKVITKMKNHKQAGFVGTYAYSKGLFGLKTGCLNFGSRR